MRYRNLYRDVVLTLIAGLLASVTVAKFDSAAVHAQPKPAYAAEVISVNRASRDFPADFASAINSAAKGRELVTVLQHGQDGRYLAIYK